MVEREWVAQVEPEAQEQVYHPYLLEQALLLPQEVWEAELVVWVEETVQQTEESVEVVPLVQTTVVLVVQDLYALGGEYNYGTFCTN